MPQPLRCLKVPKNASDVRLYDVSLVDRRINHSNFCYADCGLKSGPTSNGIKPKLAGNPQSRLHSSKSPEPHANCRKQRTSLDLQIQWTIQSVKRTNTTVRQHSMSQLTDLSRHVSDQQADYLSLNVMGIQQLI